MQSRRNKDAVISVFNPSYTEAAPGRRKTLIFKENSPDWEGRSTSDYDGNQRGDMRDSMRFRCQIPLNACIDTVYVEIPLEVIAIRIDSRDNWNALSFTHLVNDWSPNFAVSATPQKAFSQIRVTFQGKTWTVNPSELDCIEENLFETIQHEATVNSGSFMPMAVQSITSYGNINMKKNEGFAARQAAFQEGVDSMGITWRGIVRVPIDCGIFQTRKRQHGYRNTLIPFANIVDVEMVFKKRPSEFDYRTFISNAEMEYNGAPYGMYKDDFGYKYSGPGRYFFEFASALNISDGDGRLTPMAAGIGNIFRDGSRAPLGYYNSGTPHWLSVKFKGSPQAVMEVIEFDAFNSNSYDLNFVKHELYHLNKQICYVQDNWRVDQPNSVQSQEKFRKFEFAPTFESGSLRISEVPSLITIGIRRTEDDRSILSCNTEPFLPITDLKIKVNNSEICIDSDMRAQYFYKRRQQHATRKLSYGEFTENQYLICLAPEDLDVKAFSESQSKLNYLEISAKAELNNQLYGELWQLDKNWHELNMYKRGYLFWTQFMSEDENNQPFSLDTQVSATDRTFYVVNGTNLQNDDAPPDYFLQTDWTARGNELFFAIGSEIVQVTRMQIRTHNSTQKLQLTVTRGLFVGRTLPNNGMATAPSIHPTTEHVHVFLSVRKGEQWNQLLGAMEMPTTWTEWALQQVPQLKNGQWMLMQGGSGTITNFAANLPDNADPGHLFIIPNTVMTYNPGATFENMISQVLKLKDPDYMSCELEMQVCMFYNNKVAKVTSNGQRVIVEENLRTVPDPNGLKQVPLPESQPF